MADLTRLDAIFTVKSGTLDVVVPTTNGTIIAAPTDPNGQANPKANHVLHTLIYSSDQAGTIAVNDNLNGNRQDLVKRKWFGAFGGVALTDLYKKARPGASIEITVTGGGSATVDFTYHTKGLKG